MTEPLALSAKDLATLLSVSVRTVWAMNASGTIGPAPIQLSERVTRWDRREVEQWWKAQRDEGRPIRRGEWQRRLKGGAADE